MCSLFYSCYIFLLYLFYESPSILSSHIGHSYAPLPSEQKADWEERRGPDRVLVVPHRSLREVIG